MLSARWLVLLLVLGLMGCQEIGSDLAPSGEDKRPAVTAGSVGSLPGQTAPDFTEADSENNAVTLSDLLTANDSVVLYFTMWCPICDSHMSHMRTHLVPDFPSVKFLIVDYVTGSVTGARSAQLANGYGSFTVLADIGQSLFQTYAGSMGTTVVIDASGVVRMNEDYKDGSKLRTILESLP